jgi:CelD/BcsL family acetyltransferase involved in cellulose biosynthesis
VKRSITAKVLCGFDDPLLRGDQWESLLGRGSSDVVFLTREWQTAWWNTLGAGRLLLIGALVDGGLVALAPCYTTAGMVYFIGSGSSDYLDFLGDISDAAVPRVMLNAAREDVAGFVGFVFFHVPERSPTGACLRRIAPELGLVCHDEGGWPAPALELDTSAGAAASGKKSLIRHERFFHRHGTLEVTQWTSGREIAAHLPEFFDQHIRRWESTRFPSQFHQPRQRRFYEELCRSAGEAGWLRFMRLDWNGQPIAFHFGFCYRGSFMWYKPSFAIELARRSPGEVLLRQLLLAARDECVGTFDFGLGDEAFKSRFATRIEQVRTWSLYPP